MAWAIFHKLFNYSDPKSRVSFKVEPSPEPQERKEIVIAAAVEAGVAERVDPPSSSEKRKRAARRKT